jgi:hypothetical protein
MEGCVAEVQVLGMSGVWERVALLLPTDSWQTVVVDLSAYRGQVVQLQFVWTATVGAAGWRIDTLLVQEGAFLLPTPVIVEPTATVEPTPSTVTPTVVSRETTPEAEFPVQEPPLPTETPTETVG